MQKIRKTVSNKFLFCLLFCFTQLACNAPIDSNKLDCGSWLIEMNIDGNVLPISLFIEEQGKELQFRIVNGEENIVIEGLSIKEDSLVVRLPVFESFFEFKLLDSKTMSGNWVNLYKGSDYKIPVTAFFHEGSRFRTKSNNGQSKLEKKYRVSFSPDSPETSKAIGLFKQEGDRVLGTFATETGDYRHLEGCATKDSLFLSTFDGSHAFLFKAAIKEDSLFGKFWSGTHYKESWVAVKDPDFELRNADSLTWFLDQDAPFDFKLKTLEGDSISLSHPSFENKALIIQLMGSWCPNCLDESVYYSGLYNEYNPQGLEIIAVAFERTRSREQASENINKLVERLSIHYPVVLGSFTKKVGPKELFPNLNHMMSYPTSIFLNKQHQVVKIHTGFYGPGTGRYFEEYKKRTEEFVENLLSN